MGSNIIELAKLGHERASELKASCGAVDVRSLAQLISDLATQLEVQLVRGNALAALVCLSHGYQAATREWLEGTTDEAGAEIPDDISVGELPEWFDSQMVSNDGKSGFLTRGEAEVRIRAECPATDAFLAEVRASELDSLAGVAETMLVKFSNQQCSSDMHEVVGWKMVIQQASNRAAKLRKGAAL